MMVCYSFWVRVEKSLDSEKLNCGHALRRSNVARNISEEPLLHFWGQPLVLEASALSIFNFRVERFLVFVVRRQR